MSIDFDFVDAAFRDTMAAFDNPQPGDRFHEMYSFWMYVLYVAPNGGPVVALTAKPPCTVPDDGEIQVYDTANDFRKAWGADNSHGAYVMLADRDNRVDGWLEAAAVGEVDE